MKMTHILAIAVALFLIWAVWGWNPFVKSVRPQSLLQDGYLAHESGYARLSDGTVVVQALTRMPGVKAEMVRWWFAEYMQTTDHYKMWHPNDHKWMDWKNKEPGKIIGASHLVEETIGGELDKLRITFIDPAVMFGTDPNTADRFVICATPGPLHDPIRFGKMTHIVRDTPWGAEMRSCFWLGDIRSEHKNPIQRFMIGVIGNTNLLRRLSMKDWKVAAVHQHCIEEMGTLSDFLPDLYQRETE